jgi:hypothetical protein
MAIISTIDIGCVLASLNYIIRGLEGFRDAAKQLANNLEKYEYLVNNCVDQLECEHKALWKTLSTIFENNPPTCRNDWQSKHVNVVLKSKLGSSQGRFRHIQDRLKIIILNLGSRTQLNKTNV